MGAMYNMDCRIADLVSFLFGEKGFHSLNRKKIPPKLHRKRNAGSGMENQVSGKLKGPK